MKSILDYIESAIGIILIPYHYIIYEVVQLVENQIIDEEKNNIGHSGYGIPWLIDKNMILKSF